MATKQKGKAMKQAKHGKASNAMGEAIKDVGKYSRTASFLAEEKSDKRAGEGAKAYGNLARISAGHARDQALRKGKKK